MNRTVTAIGWLAGSAFVLVLFALVGIGIYNTGRMSTEPDKPAVELPELNKVHSPVSAPKQVAITPKPASPHSDHAEKHRIYRKLQDTCNRWTHWYNRDRKEVSRVNMNVSCRDAANYAKNELNIRARSPNYVAASPKSSSGGSQAILLSANSNRASSAQCRAWEVEKERIHEQLRNGYREPKGNRLRERHRDLSDLIYREC